jgi:outer membrane protein assembly factor BamB
MKPPTTALFLMVALTWGSVVGGDVPLQWYANQGRNAHVPAEDLPDHIGPDNLLWHLPLNNGAFFNIPTVKDGRIYCGVDARNLPKRERRGAALLVLDLQTGKPIWQKVVTDRAGYGLSVVPLLEDDAIYLFAKGKMMRLDMEGNLVWESGAAQQEYFDTMHGSHGTGVILGDYWYQPTGFATGSDCSNWMSNSVERPWHPNVVVVNKHTGKLVAQDDVVVGPHQHGSWSSLSTGVVNGKQLVFWGDAHGYVHAFEAAKEFPTGEVSVLKEVWKCDANPKDYRIREDGVHMPYGAMGPFGPREIGPCEIIGVPVFHQGRLYVSLARDKAYSTEKQGRRIGNGAVVCIDPSGTGDVTGTHKIWTNKNVNRTFCPPSIAEGKLFIATHAGYVCALDLSSGNEIWKRDINRCTWNYFQMVGDGKLYAMNEGDDFFIFSADEEGKQLFHTEVDARNNPSVGMVDGMLIVATRRSIAAYGGPEKMKTAKPAPLPDKPQFSKTEGDDDSDGHH